MTQLPPSFDPYIIQDQLLAALKQSPITSQLVSLRAEEIIQIILEKPIVMALEEEIRVLKLKLEEEKMNRRTLRSDSKQKYRQQQKQVNERQRLIQTLNEQIQMQAQSIQAYQSEKRQMQNIIADNEAKIQQLQDQNQSISNQHAKLRNEVSQKINKITQLQHSIVQKDKNIYAQQQQYQKQQLQLKSAIEHLERQLSKNQQQSSTHKKQHEQKLNSIITQHRSELQQREKAIQSLKEQRFAVKNEINGLKIDLQQITKLVEALRQENKQLAAQRDKLKETLRINKISNEKERKSLNQRLYELTLTYKKYQKLKTHIALLNKSISELKEQNQKLNTWITEQLKKLAAQTQQKTKMLLDEVGKHVEVQLKSLSQRLLSKNQQIKGIKSQAKMREEFLQRSQKQLTTTSKQISDLKSELRQRKREQQRLRRQLKSNYEQYESKLSKMQKKYLELLNRPTF